MAKIVEVKLECFEWIVKIRSEGFKETFEYKSDAQERAIEVMYEKDCVGRIEITYVYGRGAHFKGVKAIGNRYVDDPDEDFILYCEDTEYVDNQPYGIDREHFGGNEGGYIFGSIPQIERSAREIVEKIGFNSLGIDDSYINRVQELDQKGWLRPEEH